MKIKLATILTLLMFVTLFTGCGNKTGDDANPAPTVTAEATPAQTTPPETTPDVVTTASIVNTEEAFEAAMGTSGTWIIATIKDLEFDKDLVLEGEYKNGKKDDAGKDIIQRKIALYAQDEERNVTARYTLKAPKLTVTSPNARIQSGAFVGDLYVSAANFQLVDATVDGNVYFTSEEAKTTFTMDETSKITGKQELQK